MRCLFGFFFFLDLSSQANKMAEAVMQALSNVFDDMTLQIIQRKKEKAGAPQKVFSLIFFLVSTLCRQLVAAVGLVSACTSKLETIAVALAKDEYDDFPQIASEINEAAKAVREGSAGMAKATAALESGCDTVAAWDEVGVSVGLMVQKTIYLLDIVYGAEVKVLNLVSADAIGSLDSLSELASTASKEMTDDEVDQLVAAASKMAAKMKPVAEKLMQRAKSEPTESPNK